MRDLGIVFVIGFVAYGAFMVGAAWLSGSAITSGVKAVSGSCGETYPVEKILSGDWFCPEKE